MIVSTVPEVDVNLMLVRKIREKNNSSIVIVSCNRISDVASLYRAGADYVIVPHVVAGESLVGIISRIDLDKKKYVLETKNQSKDFDKRLKF
jgi:Trk K+ transport system NAD-binding subunit